jgi:hypothetical protein
MILNITETRQLMDILGASWSSMRRLRSFLNDTKASLKLTPESKVKDAIDVHDVVHKLCDNVKLLNSNDQEEDTCIVLTCHWSRI